MTRVEEVPGVAAVGLTDTPPLGRNRGWGIRAKGVVYESGQTPGVFPRIVDHRYLGVMEIPLLAGRYFTQFDNEQSANVVILNETAARTVFPGQDAIGQTALINGEEWQVIGVVSDVRHQSHEMESGLELYLPYTQMPNYSTLTMIVRSPVRSCGTGRVRRDCPGPRRSRHLCRPLLHRDAAHSGDRDSHGARRIVGTRAPPRCEQNHASRGSGRHNRCSRILHGFETHGVDALRDSADRCVDLRRNGCDPPDGRGPWPLSCLHGVRRARTRFGHSIRHDRARLQTGGTRMLRLALLMLIALLGADGHVQRQVGDAHVQPVLYLPADEPFSAERLALQVQAVRDAQAWYAERLNGITFFAQPLIVQRSAHAFAALAGNDFQNWWPLPAAEFAGWGMPWNDSSRIKLLILAQGAGAWAGADSENGGILAEAEAGNVSAGHLGGLAVVGDSSIGGILAGICPREGIASWRRPSGDAWWCSWNTYRGTIAHELGHTFGLPHPDAFRPGFRCDSAVVTNMQCHWAWPGDSLLPFEAAHLRSLPVFGPDAWTAWQPAAPTETRGPINIHDARDYGLLWLDGRGAGTGFRWGVAMRPGEETRLTFVPPTGARALLLDVGWILGERASDSSELRFRSADDVLVIAIDAGSLPRRVRVAVSGTPVTIQREAASTGTLGIAHPRWEMHSR